LTYPKLNISENYISILISDDFEVRRWISPKRMKIFKIG